MQVVLNCYIFYNFSALFCVGVWFIVVNQVGATANSEKQSDGCLLSYTKWACTICTFLMGNRIFVTHEHVFDTKKPILEVADKKFLQHFVSTKLRVVVPSFAH